jgi:hypothetical protein
MDLYQEQSLITSPEALDVLAAPEMAVLCHMDLISGNVETACTARAVMAATATRDRTKTTLFAGKEVRI